MSDPTSYASWIVGGARHALKTGATHVSARIVVARGSYMARVRVSECVCVCVFVRCVRARYSPVILRPFLEPDFDSDYARRALERAASSIVSGTMGIIMVTDRAAGRGDWAIMCGAAHQ